MFIAHLLARIGPRFGFRLIVEEGLSKCGSYADGRCGSANKMQRGWALSFVLQKPFDDVDAAPGTEPNPYQHTVDAMHNIVGRFDPTESFPKLHH